MARDSMETALRLRRWGRGASTHTLYMIDPTCLMLYREDRDSGWRITCSDWTEARFRGEPLGADDLNVWKGRNADLFTRCYPTRRDAIQHVEAVLVVDPMPSSGRVLIPVALRRGSRGVYHPVSDDRCYPEVTVQRDEGGWMVVKGSVIMMRARTLREAGAWVRYFGDKY